MNEIFRTKKNEKFHPILCPNETDFDCIGETSKKTYEELNFVFK